jgi:hypothetical protein
MIAVGRKMKDRDHPGGGAGELATPIAYMGKLTFWSEHALDLLAESVKAIFGLGCERYAMLRQASLCIDCGLDGQ